MNISSKDERSKINEKRQFKPLRTLSGSTNVSVLTATLPLLLKGPVHPLDLYACAREPPKRPSAHRRRQPTPCLSIYWYSVLSATLLGWPVEFPGWDLTAAFFKVWQGPCRCTLSSSTRGWVANTRAGGTRVLVGASPPTPGLTQSDNKLMCTTHCPVKWGCCHSAGTVHPGFLTLCLCDHTGRCVNTRLTEAHSSRTRRLSPTLQPPSYSLFWDYIWF